MFLWMYARDMETSPLRSSGLRLQSTISCPISNMVERRNSITSPPWSPLKSSKKGSSGRATDSRVQTFTPQAKKSSSHCLTVSYTKLFIHFEIEDNTGVWTPKTKSLPGSTLLRYQAFRNIASKLSSNTWVFTKIMRNLPLLQLAQ